jgi:hypothetical protein
VARASARSAETPSKMPNRSAAAKAKWLPIAKICRGLREQARPGGWQPCLVVVSAGFGTAYFHPPLCATAHVHSSRRDESRRVSDILVLWNQDEPTSRASKGNH